MVRDPARAKQVKRYSQEPIFATLGCPRHGVVSLTQKQYDAQLVDPNEFFRCPKCGADSLLEELANEATGN